MSDLDEQLRAAVASGDRNAALEAIFTALRQRLFNLCLRMTGNRADAEDALQDAMIGVYRGLGAFRGESSVSTWTHRIVIHSCLRHRRRHRTEPIPTDLVTSDPPPEMQSDQEVARIIDAINRLAPESRVVLHMFALKGMAHRQISDVLGIPEGTVWSRLHRARRELKDALQSADAS